MIPCKRLAIDEGNLENSLSVSPLSRKATRATAVGFLTHFLPLALFFVLVLRGLVQHYFERDTAEEQERGDQEDEARGVFAADGHSAQNGHLEDQQQRHEIHSDNQIERVMLLALFRLLEPAAESRERVLLGIVAARRFVDRFLEANPTQHRLAQVLIREKTDDLLEETTETDVHLARYRMRLAVVERVE